ncbi:hypothetical protein EKG40_03750 [Pseudomonas moorei]|nr:hypothetical protein EKG40_03750 [Pseudomonas moorei]
MDDVEEAVWRQAQSCYDSEMLCALVNSAVDSYKRLPGLDAPTRLHATSIGQEVAQTLLKILNSKGYRLGLGVETAGYVNLRYGLRAHLQNTLQRRLMQDGYASEAMTEDLLAKDLGL